MVLKIAAEVVLVIFLLFISTTNSKNSVQSKLQAYQSTFYYAYADTTFCRTVPGLTKFQIELCYQQPDTTAQALQGLNQAVKECQNQFQGHRWNCSSLNTRGKNPYISAMLQRGYKETAFAYAMSAASVAIHVARACSSGSLLNCGCDSKTYKSRKTRNIPSSDTPWQWGGCSHNLKYGVKFSKLFLDSRERAGDIHSTVNLHNNQVGRMAVSSNMQMKCKCHGMSGSCQLKTCWRAAPDLRIIGKVLKERFKSAILVDQSNVGNKSNGKINVISNQITQNKNKKRQTRLKKKKRRKDLSFDLLYYQKSPNFCEKDPTLDLSGTSGRFCNRTSSGPDSCSTLCCGRGYNLIKKKSIEMCNCKFFWCCEVKCDQCHIEQWISVCK